MDPAKAAELVDSEWSWFVRVLADAPPDVWDRPTRCSGWSVEDLARHVYWGMTLETSALRLIGSPGRGVGDTLDEPRDGIVDALDQARAGLVTALRATPSGPAVVPMPYGDVPLDLALQTFVMESAVHRSDLADAVQGRSQDLTPSAVPACAVVLQSFWAALAQAATRRPAASTGFRLQGPTVRVEAGFDGTAWGPLTGEPSVVVTGPDDALLLYAYGRMTLDRAGLDVEGDRELAERFKEIVPGP